jgi:hypothetical protein
MELYDLGLDVINLIVIHVADVTTLRKLRLTCKTFKILCDKLRERVHTMVKKAIAAGSAVDVFYIGGLFIIYLRYTGSCPNTWRIVYPISCDHKYFNIYCKLQKITKKYLFNRVISIKDVS